MKGFQRSYWGKRIFKSGNDAKKNHKKQEMKKNNTKMVLEELVTLS